METGFNIDTISSIFYMGMLYLGYRHLQTYDRKDDIKKMELLDKMDLTLLLKYKDPESYIKFKKEYSDIFIELYRIHDSIPCDTVKLFKLLQNIRISPFYPKKCQEQYNQLMSLLIEGTDDEEITIKNLLCEFLLKLSQEQID